MIRVANIFSPLDCSDFDKAKVLYSKVKETISGIKNQMELQIRHNPTFALAIMS